MIFFNKERKMFIDLGDSEVITLSTRLEIIKTMKKISYMFQSVPEYSVDYEHNEDGEYSVSKCEMFYPFKNLSKNNICIDITWETEDVLKNILNDIASDSVELSPILIEPIILHVTYKENKKEIIKRKIEEIKKELTIADYYCNEDISYEPIEIERKIDGNKIYTQIYFPCTVQLSERLTNTILNLFV